MKLAGKQALITGGSSGIGLGVTRRFREEGAKGVVISRSAGSLLQSAPELDGEFLGLPCDVTDNQALARTLADQYQAKGSLDILVVNAGGATIKNTIQPVIDVDSESFDLHVQLNFRSVFFTIQSAIPYLSPGASVIVIGSAAVHRGMAGMSVYSACKAACRSLVRCFAGELSGQGIRVNAISPGPVDTPVFDKFGLPDETLDGMKAQMLAGIPLGRIGQPQDIAGVAVMLAGEDGAFMTGSEVVVDGGFTQV